MITALESIAQLGRARVLFHARGFGVAKREEGPIEVSFQHSTGPISTIEERCPVLDFHR